MKESIFIIITLTTLLSCEQPSPVNNEIKIESEIEEKLFEAGKMRCAMRKEIQERNNKLHVSLDNWIKIWN